MPINIRRLLSPATAPRSPEKTGFQLYAAHLVTVWGLALSNLFLGLMLLVSLRRIRRLPWNWQRDAALLAPLGVYVILLAASVATSFDPAVSSDHLREILSLLTLVTGLLLVRTERDVRHLFDLLILMIALCAVFGIVQYYLMGYGDLHNRIRGPFSHYQTFAGVLLVGNFLLLARIASGEGWKEPWNWLGLGVINWTLLLNLTRGAWVAIGITLGAYLVVRARRRIVAYLALAVLLALLAPKIGLERMRSITDVRDPSNYDRLCMAEAAFFMIGERPLFGLGPGMVRERYPIYRHPTAPRLNVPHLHNTFLELAAERGLLALAAYFWLMGAGLWTAYRAYRREGGPAGSRADLYLGTLLVLVGFNVAGLFEDNWRDTEVQRLVLFLLAVPLCLQDSAETSRP